MAIEIERKFLVDKEKWQTLDKGECIFYKQGYITSEPAKTIRVRISSDKAFLTIKGNTTGASRAEFEYEIPVADANELFNNFCISSVAKNRYEISYAGKVWEVDEFLEENEGLLVAEIELESENELFDLPAWVNKEVTEESKYYNANLASHPFKKW
ncbi:MAG TPA: CYTH domain-containing protein [Chitinophagaceae bacterium]|jgi:CYTH domain-containing protein|nr:CYTH domain-containing protein [Chitinophagaceae bacterium]